MGTPRSLGNFEFCSTFPMSLTRYSSADITVSPNSGESAGISSMYRYDNAASPVTMSEFDGDPHEPSLFWTSLSHRRLLMEALYVLELPNLPGSKTEYMPICLFRPKIPSITMGRKGSETGLWKEGETVFSATAWREVSHCDIVVTMAMTPQMIITHGIGTFNLIRMFSLLG